MAINTGAKDDALIRTSVPNLISGISKQAENLRFSSQAEEQINGVSSVVSGLVKRPDINFIKTFVDEREIVKIFNLTADSLDFVCVILKSNNLLYLRIFEYNIDPALAKEYSVSYKGNSQTLLTNYLNNVSNITGVTQEGTANDIKTLSVADYTFVLNPKKQVLLLNDLSKRALVNNTEVYQNLIVVKQGFSGRSSTSPPSDFVVKASLSAVNYNSSQVGGGANDGTTEAFYYLTANFTYTSANPPIEQGTFRYRIASDNLNSGGVDPESIARSLFDYLKILFETGGNNFLRWGRIFQEGNLIVVQHPTIDFQVTIDDGHGGAVIQVINNNAQSFTDLPLKAPHLCKVKVTGLPSDEGDEYYVEHISRELNFNQGDATQSAGFVTTGVLPAVGTGIGIKGVSEGYWQETVGSGFQYKIDPATMPHALVKIGNNSFLFTNFDGSTNTYATTLDGNKTITMQKWADIACGDPDSNPYPSFVGNKIENLFFYKNRLGLLSGESIIFSEAGEFFNFFKTSVTLSLDSDPIDISSASTEINNFKYAIPFYDRLILFSENYQFSLQSDGELTSKNISLQPTTTFKMDISVPPVASGNKIYFASKNSDYTDIYEYFINNITALPDGQKITESIPNYLGNLKSIFVSEAHNYLFADLESDDGTGNELGVYKFFYSGEDKIQSSWSKWLFYKNSFENQLTSFIGGSARNGLNGKNNFVDNQLVIIDSQVTNSPLNASLTYFVREPTANSIKLALTRGGSPNSVSASGVQYVNIKPLNIYKSKNILNYCIKNNILYILKQGFVGGDYFLCYLDLKEAEVNNEYDNNTKVLLDNKIKLNFNQLSFVQNAQGNAFYEIPTYSFVPPRPDNPNSTTSIYSSYPLLTHFKYGNSTHDDETGDWIGTCGFFNPFSITSWLGNFKFVREEFIYPNNKIINNTKFFDLKIDTPVKHYSNTRSVIYDVEGEGSSAICYNYTPVNYATPELAMAQNKYIEIAIELGCFKVFEFVQFKNLLFKSSSNDNVSLKIAYSFDNVSYTFLEPTTPFTFNDTEKNISDYILSLETKTFTSDFSSKKIYFRFVFYGATSNQTTARVVLRPELTAQIVGDVRSLSLLNLNVNPFTYPTAPNVSPFIFVTNNGDTYRTSYLTLNSSNQAIYATAVNQISKIKSNALLVKIPVSDKSFDYGYIGLNYPLFYQFSKPILKAQGAKGGQVSVIDGRFQMKNGIIFYEDSRFFNIFVKNFNSEVYNYAYLNNFVSKYLGFAFNTKNRELKSGKFSFPIFSKSDSFLSCIFNDSPFQSSFLNVEYEALYSARSRRIS